MTDLPTAINKQAADISHQAQNFLRIANLLFRVAITAVRGKFDTEFHPSRLGFVLKTNKLKPLEPLKRKKIINQAQWDLLFPKSDAVATSSETFDLTLMICLIKNLTNIEINDNLPFPGNTTDGADLTRIKCYRNQIMHSKDGMLSDSTFKDWWDEISKAIIRLGGNEFKDRCKHIRCRTLESEDTEIFTEIKNTIGTSDPVPKGIRKLLDIRILEWKKEKVAETRAITQLKKMIATDNVAVAVGSSGCGKSTAIHHIALQLAQMDDYEIVIAYNPDEIRQLYNPDLKQVFVIDDVFGVATFDEDKARIWTEKSKDIKLILDSKQVKLLASCKTHIFEHRMVNSIKMLSEFSCNLSSSNYRLTDKEREKIANLYLTQNEIVLLRYSNTFSQFEFFPVLCRYYCKRKSANIVDFFSNPIQAITDELFMLSTASDQTVFATLFLFVVYNNCIFESLFSDKLKIKLILEEISDNFELKSKFSIHVVKHEMKKLVHSFIKKQNTAYSIIHDIIFDVLVHYCGIYHLDLMLEVAHTDLIRDRFVFKSFPRKIKKHELFVVIPKEMEHEYFKRLKKDIENGFIQNVFSNRNLIDEDFRFRFITDIVKEKVVSLQENTLFQLVMSMIDNGFCDIVTILLTKKINLNSYYWDGETPLFKAVCKGYINLVQILLKQKANPNVEICLHSLDQIKKKYPDIAIYSTFRTCVIPKRYSPPPSRQTHKSCGKGRSQTDNFFASKVTLSDIPGFHSSFENKVQSILHNLFTNRLPQIFSNESYKISSLHIAAYKGYTNIVKLLLSHHAELDYDSENSLVASPLCIASNQGNSDIVNLLLDNIRKLDFKVPESKSLDLKKNRELSLKSSLYVAVKKGCFDIVRVLLNHWNHTIQISSDTRFDKLFIWNLIGFATVRNHDDIVKLIVEKDKDAHFNNEKNILPLLLAISEKKTDIVKLLLEHNLDPNICENNESPLYWAAYYGQTKIVKLLLSYKCDPHIYNTKKKSPLYAAAYQGYTEIVRLILYHKSDQFVWKEENPSPMCCSLLSNYFKNYHLAVNAALVRKNVDIIKVFLAHNYHLNLYNNMENPPLITVIDSITYSLHGIYESYFEIIELLLQNNIDPNICDKDNNSPLFYASKKGSTEIVKLLLFYKSDPNICNKHNMSPLFVAALTGNIEIVKLLLDHNSNPHLCSNDNLSPLFAASSKNYNKIVKLLLDHNCEHKIYDNENNSPLFPILRSRYFAIIKFLLDNNGLHEPEDVYSIFEELISAYDCDQDICYKNHNLPLLVASFLGFSKVVKVLLDHGCMDNICKKESKLPLLIASSKGHTATVKLFLDNSSYVNVYFENNVTPLHLASFNGQTETVQLLLDYNCDPCVCIENNISPLFVASSKGYTQIVTLLLDYAIYPNVCTKKYESPLFAASGEGYTEIVKLLLNHNCDPYIRTSNNASPLFIAIERRHKNIVRLLLNYYRDCNVQPLKCSKMLFVQSQITNCTKTHITVHKCSSHSLIPRYKYKYTTLHSQNKTDYYQLNTSPHRQAVQSVSYKIENKTFGSHLFAAK